MKEISSKNCSSDSSIDDCPLLNSVAIYCVLLFLVSLVSNFMIILILIKNKKELLHQINILIFVLAFLNLIGTLIGLPVVMITAFKCKFVLHLQFLF